MMDAQLGPPKEGGGGFLSDAFDGPLAGNDTDIDDIGKNDEDSAQGSSSLPSFLHFSMQVVASLTVVTIIVVS
jgi:hypothetical protein